MRLVDEDEQAGGKALEVSCGMIRMRYRHGGVGGSSATAGTALLEPGVPPVKVEIELGPTANCFAVGHRLRLEITSSCFPNHDRNHNTGGDDLWETEMVPATNIVWHSGSGKQSRLELPIL